MVGMFFKSCVFGELIFVISFISSLIVFFFLVCVFCFVRSLWDVRCFEVFLSFKNLR